MSGVTDAAHEELSGALGAADHFLHVLENGSIMTWLAFAAIATVGLLLIDRLKGLRRR